MKVKLSRNFFVILAMDIFLLFCSIWIAHLIRFELAEGIAIMASSAPVDSAIL